MTSNSLHESYRDLKFSLILFRQNYGAFLKTQLFALLAVFVSLVLLIIGFIVFEILIPGTTLTERVGEIVLVLIFVVVLGAINIFLTTQYGLANDIFASGDMFAEFRGAFYYFKNRWKQYLVLILVLNFPTIISVDISDEHKHQNLFRALGIIIRGLYDFIVLLLFQLSFPSVTVKPGIKRSLVESLRIFRRYTRRVVGSWSLYFIIFEIPGLLLSYFFEIGVDVTTTKPLYVLVVVVLMVILMAIIEFIRYPINVLISTRMYHTLQPQEEDTLVSEHNVLGTSELIGSGKETVGDKHE